MIEIKIQVHRAVDGKFRLVLVCPPIGDNADQIEAFGAGVVLGHIMQLEKPLNFVSNISVALPGSYKP
jgi:hypothetical protein